MREMKLQDLKSKTPTELLSFAEELEVENASTMRKQELMFAILKQLAIADLKLDEPIGGQALTQKVEAIAPAESRKAGRLIEDKGEAAREIADFLAGLKVI